MPICRRLQQSGKVDILVAATNMHLMEQFGHTVDEIIADGFEPAVKIPIDLAGDDDASRAHAMAKCLDGFATAFTTLRPDAVLMLGDRYEMLAVASAAAVMHIPVIHVAGGEISEGALDDSFRHAITKLSSLHLTATEEYRRRVIQMGENPDTVINTGAIGVWNAFNADIATRPELETMLGIDFGKTRPAVVTYHPATNDTVAAETRIESLLEALDAFPDLFCVITAPNNDAGGKRLLDILIPYSRQNASRVKLVRSLGMRNYQGLLQHAQAVIGNSSSGIVEAPSAGIPAVDIGIRQKGRLAAPSVIHCGDSADEIKNAIAIALSKDFQSLAAKKQNPYFQPDTLDKMTRAIIAFLDRLPAPPKKFHDLS